MVIGGHQDGEDRLSRSMRKRGARPLKELYDLTDRIAEPEITPVLEGSCRIQGPVDELEHEPVGTNPGMFHAEERCTSVNEDHHPRVESGTCNVCCAPCSSCMHLNRTSLVMESKIESSFSGSTFGRKESDSCSFLGVDGLHSGKSRTCDDNQNAASETSNFVSASSSHDSYSENAESKATFRASVIYNASDVVDMPLKVTSVTAVGDSELLPEKSSAPAPGSFSSQNQNIPHGCHKTSVSQDEEQRGSECHGDNTSLSCITGLLEASAVAIDSMIEKKDSTYSSASTNSLLAKGSDSSVQVGTLRGFHDQETEGNQSNSRMSSRGQAESKGHKSAASTSANAGFSNMPTVLSQTVQSLGSLSQKGYIMFNANSKSLEGKTSSEPQIEPFGYSLQNAESSLRGSLVAISVKENALTEVENYENSQGSLIRRDNSSVDLNDAEGSLGTDNDIGGGISSNNVSSVNEQLETANLVMETANMERSKMQQQLTVEVENSESDGLLDDVKICDTCGDAGREFELAICSRCSDGAEHIYCMRIQMTKLPEGDWLCEECQAKEDNKDQKAEKCEAVSRTSIPTFLSEEGHNFVRTSNHKLLPKLDTKEVDPEDRGITKGPETPKISSMRQAGNLVGSLTTARKASETSGGPMGTSSPRKKTVLSCENSFKDLDMAKAKPVNKESSCGNQAASNSLIVSRLHASKLGSKSFKVQAPIHSPRVPFSRSNSFNNPNMKPSQKFKHITENICHTKKITRQSTCFDPRKEGVIRSASFKSGNLSHSNTEAGGKSRRLNMSQSEDLGGLLQTKERNLKEKKNLSILNRTLVSSPVSGSSAPLLKHDLKVAQHDAKLKDTSEAKSRGINKGSDDANDNGCKEAKKLFSCLPKNIGNQSTDRSCNSEDQKPFHLSKESVHVSSTVSKSSSKPSTVLQRGVTQAVDSILHDNKSKEPALFSNKKQAVSGGNRMQRCQKCNEIGHVGQFCPVDKLSISALKPSIQRNLHGIKKSCKLKDATETAISNTRIQKSNELPDQLEELKIPCPTTSCGAASEIFSNPSSDPFSGNLPVLGGVTRDPETLRGLDSEPDKNATPIAVKQQAMQPVEGAVTPPVNDSKFVPIISDEANAKPLVPDQVSVLPDSLRASTIPELEVIWQGGFKVLRSGRIPRLFDGIQAHISTCASPKVLEVVTKLPCEFQLEEVPCISSWPWQFQGSSVKDDNIALFFFAKDIESYDKSYLKLLENMLLNDLALKGNINGVELLIFPSNKLSASFQRWNSLYFLWGVLRGKRNNCLEVPSCFQKHLSDSISCKHPMVQNLPSLPIDGVCSSKKVKLCEKVDMELPMFDGSSKLEAVMSTTPMDSSPASSSGFVDETCQRKIPPVFYNSCQPFAENKLHSETISVDVRCSVNSMGQKPSIPDTLPQSSLQLNDRTICREGNIDATYQQKNMNAVMKGREVDKHLVHTHGNYAMTDQQSFPVNEDSSNCRQGAEGCKNEDKVTEKANSIKREGVQEDDHQESFIERLELRSNRKHSAETVSTSDESSKSTSEAKLWTGKADSVPIKGERVGCKNEDKVTEKVNSIKREDVQEDNRQESLREFRSNRKRSMETVSTSGESSKSTLEAKLWTGKADSVSIEGERVCKKIKCHGEGFYANSFRDENSGVTSASHNNSNEQQYRDGKHSESEMHALGGAERCFFPMDLALARYVKPDDIINVPSDDEGMPESSLLKSHVPDLELALWVKSKTKADREGKMKLPSPMAEDEASLSLSLGFPSAGKNPISKMEKLIPDIPDLNTELLL